MPSFQDICGEQLDGLLRAALFAPEKRTVALEMLASAPAFEQLDSAALTSILTSSFTGAAIAAEAGSMKDNLSELCKHMFCRGHTMPATSSSDAISGWLLPALTAALQAGMHAEADALLRGVRRCVFNADQLMTLLQASLKMDETGRVYRTLLGMLPDNYKDWINAERTSQLLQCVSPLLIPVVKLTLTASKGWSSISAHDKLAKLLPLLLPWLWGRSVQAAPASSQLDG